MNRLAALLALGWVLAATPAARADDVGCMRCGCAGRPVRAVVSAVDRFATPTLPC